MRRPENDGSASRDDTRTPPVRNSSARPIRNSDRLASSVDQATPVVSAIMEGPASPKNSMSMPNIRPTLISAIASTIRRIPSDSNSTTTAAASTVNGRLKTLTSRYARVWSRISSGVPMASMNASVNANTPAE